MIRFCAGVLVGICAVVAALIYDDSRGRVRW
jgi:hypothetical protein